MSPFFAAWMMSDYGVGISLVEMLLWVAVIVTPRLCRSYIRRPALRCTLLLGHRYAKLLGCWLSLGVVADDHVGLALMGYFVTLGQYAFSGWQNSMTLVSGLQDPSGDTCTATCLNTPTPAQVHLPAAHLSPQVSTAAVW